MSGRSKQIVYYLFLAVVTLGGAAGTALLAYFGLRFADVTALAVLLAFCVCIFLFPLHTVLHEAGHALCGALAGMRTVSFSVGYVRFDWSRKFSVSFSLSQEAGGATALLPRGERGVRGKLTFALLGGALFNFLYGAVFLTLYFVLPHHLALMFFVLFAPLNLCEGLLALYPIELSAGKTDGKFALDLVQKKPDAEVALRVMTAQGLLYKMTYAELPRELLFDTPVVREDCTAFLAFLQLRFRALFCAGDAEAVAPLVRLRSLSEYLPAASRGEAVAEFRCMGALFPQSVDADGYAEEPCGTGALARLAAYARDASAENAERAARAVGEVKIYGERDYLEALFSALQKKISA